MDIEWTDTDPNTGQRRFLCAERFGGKWTFWFKYQRRGEWTHRFRPSVETWEIVLDSLERRCQRRGGVSEDDVRQVQKIIKEKRARFGEPEPVPDPADGE